MQSQREQINTRGVKRKPSVTMPGGHLDQPLRLTRQRKKPQKPVICDTCNKTFSNPYNLRVHMESHSDKEKNKTFVCAVCKRPSRSRDAMRKHFSLRHREIWEREMNEFKTFEGVKPYKPKKVRQRIMHPAAETASQAKRVVMPRNDISGPSGSGAPKSVSVEDKQGSSVAASTESGTADDSMDMDKHGVCNFKLQFYDDGVTKHDPRLKPFLYKPDLNDPNFGRSWLSFLAQNEVEQDVPERDVTQENPSASTAVGDNSPVSSSSGGSTPDQYGTSFEGNTHDESLEGFHLDTPSESGDDNEKPRRNKSRRVRQGQGQKVEMDQVVKHLDQLRAYVDIGLRYAHPHKKCMKRLEQFETTYRKWNSNSGSRLNGGKSKTVSTSSQATQAGRTAGSSD